MAAPLPILEGYAVEQELGKGGWANVYLATSHADGRAVAIKQFVSQNGSDVDRRTSSHEQKMLQALGDHPNIVSFVDVVIDSASVEAIVLEYCGGGDMIGLIKQLFEDGAMQTGLAQEQRIFPIWRDIVVGVQHMHACSISHLDLKPQNVLLTDIDAPRAKLCDFSHSFLARGDAQEVPPTQIGAGRYMAPEVSSGIPYPGYPADVWSCGVILYTLLTGKLPFPNDDEIKKGTWRRVPWFSAALSALLEGIFTVDHQTRLTIKGIMSGDWWASMEDRGASGGGAGAVANSETKDIADQVAASIAGEGSAGSEGLPAKAAASPGVSASASNKEASLPHLYGSPAIGEGSESDQMSYQEYDAPSDVESEGAAVDAGIGGVSPHYSRLAMVQEEGSQRLGPASSRGGPEGVGDDDDDFYSAEEIAAASKVQAYARGNATRTALTNGVLPADIVGAAASATQGMACADGDGRVARPSARSGNSVQVPAGAGLVRATSHSAETGPQRPPPIITNGYATTHAHAIHISQEGAPPLAAITQAPLPDRKSANARLPRRKGDHAVQVIPTTSLPHGMSPSSPGHAVVDLYTDVLPMPSAPGLPVSLPSIAHVHGAIPIPEMPMAGSLRRDDGVAIESRVGVSGVPASSLPSQDDLSLQAQPPGGLGGINERPVAAVAVAPLAAQNARGFCGVGGNEASSSAGWHGSGWECNGARAAQAWVDDVPANVVVDDVRCGAGRPRVLHSLARLERRQQEIACRPGSPSQLESEPAFTAAAAAVPQCLYSAVAAGERSDGRKVVPRSARMRGSAADFTTGFEQLQELLTSQLPAAAGAPVGSVPPPQSMAAATAADHPSNQACAAAGGCAVIAGSGQAGCGLYGDHRYASLSKEAQYRQLSAVVGMALKGLAQVGGVGYGEHEAVQLSRRANATTHAPQPHNVTHGGRDSKPMRMSNAKKHSAAARRGPDRSANGVEGRPSTAWEGSVGAAPSIAEEMVVRIQTARRGELAKREANERRVAGMGYCRRRAPTQAATTGGSTSTVVPTGRAARSRLAATSSSTEVTTTANVAATAPTTRTVLTGASSGALVGSNATTQACKPIAGRANKGETRHSPPRGQQVTHPTLAPAPRAGTRCAAVASGSEQSAKMAALSPRPVADGGFLPPVMASPGGQVPPPVKASRLRGTSKAKQQQQQVVAAAGSINPTMVPGVGPGVATACALDGGRSVVAVQPPPIGSFMPPPLPFPLLHGMMGTNFGLHAGTGFAPLPHPGIFLMPPPILPGDQHRHQEG